jgi:hypothetical protein
MWFCSWTSWFEGASFEVQYDENDIFLQSKVTTPKHGKYDYTHYLGL